MLVDWTLQEYAGILSTNPRRFMTGLIAGFGFGLLVIRIVVLLAGVVREAVF